MNSSEKKLAKKQLTEEQKVLKALKSIYNKSLQDVQKNIADLNSRTDMQNVQSIIYQRKYQEALETQIKVVLDNLNKNSYSTIEDYVKDSYINGYTGNMWLLQQQTGLTCVVPIDERKVVRAYTNDSKISTRYYHQNNPLKGRIAEDVDLLKARIKSNVSRGIASGKTWTETAYDIASGMNSVFSKAMNDAMRIARTEGHRVNQQGFLDAGNEAIDKGADIVKQWDATLDSVTRPWHQEADGQIREWNEDFIVGGEKMEAPSVGGSAFNVCNCRCQLLQRAKWMLDEDELQALEDRASFFGLDKTKDFDDFKNKYMQLPKNADKIDASERRKKYFERKQTQKDFIPAKDMNEVKSRLSNSLGIDGSKINLGRMKLELANQYLDGVETFMNDFPEMKGLYTAMNTKRCRGGTLGINALEAKGRYNGKNLVYDCIFELGFRNSSDLNNLYSTYKYAYESAQHFKGASPKATAIHELTHGLTHAIMMMKNGYFKNNKLQTVISGNEWNTYSQSASWKLVNDLKRKMYGDVHGRDVFDGLKHLGSYALTNSDETIAQAVAYEYINKNDSKEFSANLLKALKEEVRRTFK